MCEKEKNIKMSSMHILYYDILNILACISVVYMHSNGIVHTYSDTSAWRQSMFVESVCYWAVPVFFMLSGATLLNYQERYTTKIYLKRRLVRVGIPFIAWSIISLIWKCYSGTLIVKRSAREIISLIFNSEIENVYWFFIPLFSIYLSIPVLAKIRQERKMLKYMLICGITTYSILPTICALMGIKYNNNFLFPLAGGYIIYVILGYYISTMDIERRKRYCIYILGIFCLALRYCSTVVLSEEGELYTMFWGYTNFPAVGLSLSVFVLFKYIDWARYINKEKVKRLIISISASSFGIYLIHMFVLNEIWEYGVTGYSLKWRVLGAPLVYIFCLGVIQVIKRIPVLNKLVP